MKVISKVEAELKGLHKFFTGEPCKNGHLAERYTFYSRCVECAKLNLQRQRAKNKAALSCR